MTAADNRKQRLLDLKVRRLLDLKVRRLLAREARGEAIPQADILRVCPYRTVLAREDIVVSPGTRADRVAVALGFKREDFDELTRRVALIDIQAGKVVLLVSNIGPAQMPEPVTLLDRPRRRPGPARSSGMTAAGVRLVQGPPRYNITPYGY
jgi:hypothetical protein